MPDTKPKKVPPLPEVPPAPLPVDVISSIPLSVQLAPESLASLGAPPAGTAEPVTAAAPATSQATLTPQVAPAGAPVNVTVVAPQSAPDTVVKGEGHTLAPTTTEQEDVVTAGQRRVNLIWEFTQAFIAIVVVLSNMIAAVYNVFMGREVDVPMILSSSLFLIIGFYFSRTNHQSIGGEGKQPSKGPYEGR